MPNPFEDVNHAVFFYALNGVVPFDIVRNAGNCLPWHFVNSVDSNYRKIEGNISKYFSALGKQREVKLTQTCCHPQLSNAPNVLSISQQRVDR